jgi:predicted enzyme related to lactoylglutathione lyase
MLKGVAVVWMPVQDIERAKGFYRDTLGLQITNEDGEWAEVDANGLTIGLNGREPSGVGAEGGPVLTFQPEGGLEETLDDLKGQGVKIPAGISEHPWGRVATFKDSEGNGIQLYEAPKN